MSRTVSRPTKRVRALELRSTALKILSLVGAQPPVLSAHGHGLKLLHRTPFSGLAKRSQESSYQAAFLRQSSLNLPYGLDIWIATGKVLNLEWTDGDGRVDVVSFKRGEWEVTLLGWLAELDLYPHCTSRATPGRARTGIALIADSGGYTLRNPLV